MFLHVKLVNEHSPHRGSAHYVLRYLAECADPKRGHTCRPGNKKIAQDLRMHPDTVKKVIPVLIKSGCVRRITQGNGSGHASVLQLAEIYWPAPKKGGDRPPIEQGTGVVDPPYLTETGATDPPSEKRGVSDPRRGVSDPQKGGDRPPLISNKNKQEERERARASPALSPDVPAGANSYAAMFKTISGIWVGFTQQEYLVERLGESPDWNTLHDVWKLWSNSGNRQRNLVGLFDWYDQRRANPDWQPYKARSMTTNGQAPKYVPDADGRF